MHDAIEYYRKELNYASTLGWRRNLILTEPWYQITPIPTRGDGRNLILGGTFPYKIEWFNE